MLSTFLICSVLASDSLNLSQRFSFHRWIESTLLLSDGSFPFCFWLRHFACLESSFGVLNRCSVFEGLWCRDPFIFLFLSIIYQIFSYIQSVSFRLSSLLRQDRISIIFVGLSIGSFHLSLPERYLLNHQLQSSIFHLSFYLFSHLAYYYLQTECFLATYYPFQYRSTLIGRRQIGHHLHQLWTVFDDLVREPCGLSCHSERYTVQLFSFELCSMIGWLHYLNLL